jgi:hypothetical protein
MALDILAGAVVDQSIGGLLSVTGIPSHTHKFSNDNKEGEDNGYQGED